MKTALAITPKENPKGIWRLEDQVTRNHYLLAGERDMFAQADAAGKAPVTDRR